MQRDIVAEGGVLVHKCLMKFNFSQMDVLPETISQNRAKAKHQRHTPVIFSFRYSSWTEGLTMLTKNNGTGSKVAGSITSDDAISSISQSLNVGSCKNG